MAVIASVFIMFESQVQSAGEQMAAVIWPNRRHRKNERMHSGCIFTTFVNIFDRKKKTNILSSDAVLELLGKRRRSHTIAPSQNF